VINQGLDLETADPTARTWLALLACGLRTKIEKFNLIGRGRLPFEQPTKRLLCRFTVQTNQGTQKEAEPLTQPFGALHVGRRSLNAIRSIATQHATIVVDQLIN
jgi:hypothetical protein